MGYVTPAHSWHETNDEVHVRVYIQGMPRQTFDVFATSCFLKVNAPPYYFACDLEDEIDQNTCVVIVDSHGVEFKCKKFQPGKRWGRLMRFMTPQTKNDIARRRLVSVQATYGRANVSRAAAAALSAEEGKAQLTKQWKLNQKHRNIIQERAEAELTAERNIARSWRQEPESIGTSDSCIRVESENDNYTYRLGNVSNANLDGMEALQYNTQSMRVTTDHCLGLTRTADNKSAFGKSHRASLSSRTPDSFAGAKNSGQTTPRLPIRVGLDFTKLEYENVPARESREPRFHQLKQKANPQERVDMERTKPLTALEVPEQEPIFVKDKGDIFFRVGNYRSALSAYTQAVNAKKKMKDPSKALVKLYANRAACYLINAQPELAIDDCTMALDLLKSIEANENCSSSGTHDADDLWRQKLLVRRAKAHIALKKLHHARNDLGAAVDMGENRADISRDLEEVRLCSVFLDTTSLQGIGDARYCAKNFTGAMRAYDLALKLPGHFGNLSKANILVSRAACRLSLSDYEGARSDCETALNIILCGGINTWERNGRPHSVLSSDDEIIHDDTAHRCVDIGVEWNNVVIGLLIKILHRRGAAAAHVQRYHHAVSDYQFAAGLMIGETKSTLDSDASVIYHVAFK